MPDPLVAFGAAPSGLQRAGPLRIAWDSVVLAVPRCRRSSRSGFLCRRAAGELDLSGRGPSRTVAMVPDRTGRPRGPTGNPRSRSGLVPSAEGRKGEGPRGCCRTRDVFWATPNRRVGKKTDHAFAPSPSSDRRQGVRHGFAETNTVQAGEQLGGLRLLDRPSPRPSPLALT